MMSMNTGIRNPRMAALSLTCERLTALPEVKPQGYFNAWPEYFHSFADQVGQEPVMRKPRPSPRMITEADEAMLWLRWLEVEDAKLVWARANGKAWKPICWQFGLSRTAATRRWKFGLAVIVWHLNGRMPPVRRSMDFVIKRARSGLTVG